MAGVLNLLSRTGGASVVDARLCLASSYEWLLKASANRTEYSQHQFSVTQRSRTTRRFSSEQQRNC